MSDLRAGDFLPHGINNHARRFAPEVIAAISRVPRHLFVPEDYAEFAYEDRALPIGLEQTISQPFIVALMTEEAAVAPGKKILEIGTGSGYQAAVLSELGARVYTVEYLPELSERAEKLLRELGYREIKFKTGDGWLGWEEESPFDAVLVTASSPGFPPELIRQLVPGGRMLIPLETSRANEERLKLLTCLEDGLKEQDLGSVRFVPLVGMSRKGFGLSVQASTNRPTRKE
jgi:protein-L-isoaspartate(D-aspartate) O-methyltransferase